MPAERDYFKLVTGKKLKEVTKIPTVQETLDRQWKELQTKYPLRLLGTSQDGDVWVSEEEREVNFHILGAPGEGKSRFLEYNIRKDIDAGIGLCLLDPSEKGDTVNNVLAYCEKIGYEKVILIDPTTIQIYDKIPCLHALNPKNIKSSVDGITESLAILFGSKTVDTPRIKRYLTALLRILTKANLSLYETKYFADYQQFRGYRQAIFEKIYGDQTDVRTLQNIFKSEYNWQNYFSSTINRLDALWEEPLLLMLGNNEGINFVEAISQGWVILVNLTPYRLTSDESRLLGLIVVSQIFQAVNTLVNNGWKGVHYLYMDEAGRFATPQIKELLQYKRKSGLRLILAHHDFDQFKDQPDVMTAIVNGARIKLMFDTPSYDDRMKMVKQLGYGGDIPPALASFANQNIPKQYAVLRKHKETPVRIKIPDVKPCKPVSKEYIEQILSQPFYKSKQEIKDQINARLTPTYPKRSQRGEAPDGKANNRNTVSNRATGAKRKSIPADSKKPPITKNKEPFKF